MANNFRLQGLNAQSVNFADPLNLQHILNQKVRTNPKKVGQTDDFLNRVEMKEINPRIVTDGTATTRIDQVVTVEFSGYTSGTATDELIASWTRMKTNVDLAIANGVLKGFKSDNVAFIAGV